MIITMALSLQRTRITSALGAKRFDVMLPSDYPFPGYKLVRTMPNYVLIAIHTQ